MENGNQYSLDLYRLGRFLMIFSNRNFLMNELQISGNIIDTILYIWLFYSICTNEASPSFLA